MENQRFISLDAFRGFTIAAMLLVNYPGSWDHVYEPLLHVAWNGISPTDLIYPFFLFIVGVSMTLSFRNRQNTEAQSNDLLVKVVVRSLKIFGVGIFLNLFPAFDFENLRIAGVLQRIGVVYLFCGVVYLYTNWRQQAYISAALLIGYWLLMTMVPVPGLGQSMLEPGQNLAAWVDSQFLPGKMWQGTWDPEGLLSTMPAFVTTLSGILAGRYLISQNQLGEQVNALFVAGFLSACAGALWHYQFPINKNLWTSSYVLFTSGLATMMLATMIFMTEIKGYRKWTSVGIIYGSNAITVYVLASILSYLFYELSLGGSSLNQHWLTMATGMGMASKLASMIYALGYVSLMFLPAYYLYNRRIFIRL